MQALTILAFLLSSAASPPAAATTLAGPVHASTPAHDALIRTPADLSRYLSTTAPGASPLDALPPAARKRFLASLRFGSKGLGGFSTSDLDAELNHAQVARLLALFGMQSYAQGIGLTQRRYARVRAERLAYARRRGCRVGACPESDIEQRYDQLVAAMGSSHGSLARRTAAIDKRYALLFGKHSASIRLRQVASPDLRLLKRAVETVIFYSPAPVYLARLRAILAEMQRRGMTDDADYASLYKGMVAARQFGAAASLRRRHPGLDVARIPAWQSPGTLPREWPTAITLSADGRQMTRRAFDLNLPLRIVVVASCHFSRDAARAIDAQPRLRRLFADHAIWLADQSEEIDAARSWNQQFPDQPIHIAWRNREWDRLSDWDMPTFYVFRRGKLVDHWSGWSAGTGMKQLREHLRRDGASGSR